MKNILTCPSCKIRLQILGTLAKCPDCAFQTKPNKNYFDFLGNSGYYWGEVSQSEARTLVHNAGKTGYIPAVNNFETKHPGMSEYMLSYSRADWIYAGVDPSRCKRALDIGSGWGSIAFSLSYHLDEVWSMDSVSERLEFQVIRASQEKRSNIHFIRSDWLTLPFADSSFDLVSVNGVLEWIGLSDFSVSPECLQRKFISEIYRILKPGGCLYIGIENRLAFFLFLGALDHSGLPFTSLMPRFIADYIIRKFRKNTGKYYSEQRSSLNWPNYRTYTYTKYGYSQLLKKVGFVNPSFQWALSYNSPTESGNFDGESFKFLLRHFKEHDFSVTISSKLATRFGQFVPRVIYKYLFQIFCPSFLIFAYKQYKPKTFEDKLLNCFPDATSFVRRSGTHGRSSGINYFILKNGVPKNVVKFSRFQQFMYPIKNANHTKVSVKKLDGRVIAIEPFLDGHICQTLSMSDNLSAIRWLSDWQLSSKDVRWSKLDLDKHFAPLFSVIKNLGGNERIVSKKLLTLYLKCLKKTPPLIVSEHGDYVKTNLIVDGSKVSVLDWEFYHDRSIPLFDFLTFIITNSRVDNFELNFTGRGSYSPILRSMFRYYSTTMNTGEDRLLDGVLYVLLRSLSRRYVDNSGKHLDTKPLMDLIRIWCKIYPAAKKWISSK